MNRGGIALHCGGRTGVKQRFVVRPALRTRLQAESLWRVELKRCNLPMKICGQKRSTLDEEVFRVFSLAWLHWEDTRDLQNSATEARESKDASS